MAKVAANNDRKSELNGKTFVAHEPYAPTIGNSKVSVDIGAPQITYDFSGHVPFYNPAAGRSDIHTINVWDPVNKRAQVVQGWQLKDDGVKDRVFKQKGYTAIGIIAGDGIVEEKLRTQVNAFPISTR
ncbi:hypothetical protein EGI20_13485, partial [Aquitalea sp. S1-19]|nr:hypothetical protein [Aquitalea sp. S1-19]